MPSAAAYPIRAVARLTGLSLDTLRAWERRYQAVMPSRGERGRVYSARDVARLTQLGALVEQGHAIGDIASLSDAALRKLDTAPDSPAALPGDLTQWGELASMREAITSYDLEALEAMLSRQAFVLPPPELIFRVILPLLRDVGDRWESGAICPAQEHLVSAVIRGVLATLLRSVPRRSTAPPIVFATPSGQRHELGLLCAALLAAWAGHGVMFLGPDLPPADIVRAARASRTRLVVLACTVSADADSHDLKLLKRLPRQVAILVGGPTAAGVSRLLGARARHIETLEAFRVRLDSYV